MISAKVRRRIKKVLLWTEVLFILVLGAGMGIVLGAFYQMNKLLPPDAVLDRYRPPIGTKIYSSDGVLLAKLAAENREPIPLDKIPKNMQNAIVAIEDSRFYQHSGLDFRGLVRALWANISGRELAQGGSTITQQLARNMFLSQRKKISRKIKEILLAIQIERNWTKRAILEAYLNQVYFGAGAYGVKSAAQTYFGKKVEDLKVEEAALLAGLPQRPSDLNPFNCYLTHGNYDGTKGRRNMVLDRMAHLGYITAEQAAKAKEAPVKVVKQRPRMTGYLKAKYFVQHAVDQLRDQLNYDEDLLNKAGLKVITTLNWGMQEAAEKAAREGLKRYRRRGRVSEVALVCIDPHTGYIRAMVGGANEPWEKYQFNCATQARRQPGSSFKMFVYATALEQGHSPYSSVNAAAQSIRQADGSWWSPKNHGRHSGRMSYVQAFAASVNGAAVNVCVSVGPRKVVEMAHRLGVKGNLRAYPSIALGTSEVTPLEMASAYGVFPAKGTRVEPLAILQIRGPDNEIIDEVRPRVINTGLKASTIEGMHTLTRAVVTGGTGTAARGVPGAHGKTGTSEEYTDAWFIGYTPDLVTAVWAGNRDNSQMAHVYGGTICSPIWADFMTTAVKINPVKKARKQAQEVKKKPRQRPRRQREQPVAPPMGADENDRNRVRVTVCTETGMRASDYCPSTETQEFLLGEQPMSRCPIHASKKPESSKEKSKDKGEESGEENKGQEDSNGTASPSSGRNAGDQAGQ
jgi:penicillin-binding protein 1A